MSTKFIFITGGVVSSLGKGITAASLGRLLKNRGLRVTMQKLDPYFNVDPGTMSPYQHGEVFVTDDGAETDLDLGHYERFIDESLSKNSSATSGKIYWSVLTKERQGEYLGGTVQVIPHITNEIKSAILKNQSDDIDVCIVEIGGTVGDIESQPFIEAIRQLKYELKNDCLFVHTTLVPYLPMSGELKTKPTQHSVKTLQSLGIQPDIVVCRTTSEQVLDERSKDKIALFCSLPGKDHIINNKDASTLYAVPLLLKEEKFDEMVCKLLNINSPKPEADMKSWEEMVNRLQNINKSVKVALIGKYVQLQDAYLSLAEALRHGGIANDVRVDIEYIDAEKINSLEDVKKLTAGCQGIVVPGGFGERGTEGKIYAVQYARENNIPYLGICLGLQIAIIDYCRNILGIKDANSTEIDETTKNPVIDILENQVHITEKGGTMRLGKYDCVLNKDSLSYKLYGKEVISERHRHRYEVNNAYVEQLKNSGMVIAGVNPDMNVVEIVELPKQKFFVGVQFHPEFKSRPNHPHPLFAGFIEAASK